MRAAVDKLWPEIQWIQDSKLRDQVAETWVKALERSSATSCRMLLQCWLADLASPHLAILAAAMMVEQVGETDKADRIRNAVAAVVKESRVHTYDMMRISGGAKSINQGAASTVQMTDAIRAKL